MPQRTASRHAPGKRRGGRELGARPADLELRGPREPVLAGRERAEDRDPRLRLEPAELRSLLHRGDADGGGPGLERGAGAVGGTVAVRVGLDDGPELGGPGRLAHASAVPGERAESDRDLRPSPGRHEKPSFAWPGEDTSRVNDGPSTRERKGE